MSTFEVTDGVYGIDIGMFDSGVASVYLFDDDEPTLVDAGIAATAETIRDGLKECGVAPSELSNLVCSHVHVDHSGAASDLVDAAPDLDVFIHESTAPHLIDPSGLVESSKRAMGDHFELMGEQGPVPEENVVGVPNEGRTLDIGTNSLELIYAPGHSPDHFAVWNPERELLFAAECLGLYLAEADQWLPPATLPNFDVELIADAVDRLEELEPDRIVFPHFGEWPYDPVEAFETARAELRRYDERILELYEETGSREETKRAVDEELLELAPPYDPAVESFFASLLTDGYLKYHDRV
ncbi:beta-lactamase domain protein (plasmid) [Haloterrigena turkmenica DSM 5511]|uniref:Beta-lactamase domain protein n=1 Tax=Haloterrigena turkmenica (strain ATCC 51198 / DSM 5511 / JCM 9101 / NCIMB 13204 / VKM B-1734 / 4k) TaxID=543526 RepID=D2S1C1_HALTV|nr:MBL fold metallo-hydrolase [Haloterrigena turkmenica]ADB63168.1 beta-lactamase domain protein [Haloterrigena turkmenica DSM 5511]